MIDKKKVEEAIMDALKYSPKKQFSAQTLMAACKIVFHVTKANPNASFEELFAEGHLQDFWSKK